MHHLVLKKLWELPQPEAGQAECEPSSSEDTADHPCCLLGGIPIFHPRVYGR